MNVADQMQDVVVSETASCLDQRKNIVKYSLVKDHFNMNKFADSQDDEFGLVKREVILTKDAALRTSLLKIPEEHEPPIIRGRMPDKMLHEIKRPDKDDLPIHQSRIPTKRPLEPRWAWQDELLQAKTPANTPLKSIGISELDDDNASVMAVTGDNVKFSASPSASLESNADRSCYECRNLSDTKRRRGWVACPFHCKDCPRSKLRGYREMGRYIDLLDASDVTECCRVHQGLKYCRQNQRARV